MSDKDEPWLVRTSSIRLMWRFGIAFLAVLAALDFLIPPHGHFGIDGTFGFYSWYGFATCFAMVVVAKLLGYLVKRGEDYYDR